MVMLEHNYIPEMSISFALLLSQSAKDESTRKV